LKQQSCPLKLKIKEGIMVWLIGLACWILAIVVLVLFFRGVAEMNKNYTKLESEGSRAEKAHRALRNEAKS
jgi:Na+-transporting methylmalonyl-CoA/oxaloacetate decarboxylase gamma subunit